MRARAFVHCLNVLFNVIRVAFSGDGTRCQHDLCLISHTGFIVYALKGCVLLSWWADWGLEIIIVAFVVLVVDLSLSDTPAEK